MSDSKHLLSFVTSDCGRMVSIHADLSGLSLLIEQLTTLRDLVSEGDCPHTHLFSWAGDDELTKSKLENQSQEVNIVDHVKIYGWNDEWAVKHGLRPK